MRFSDIFQSVKGWAQEKSEMFLHGEPVNQQGNYYGSDEDAQAYGAMNHEEPVQEAPQADPYGYQGGYPPQQGNQPAGYGYQQGQPPYQGGNQYQPQPEQGGMFGRRQQAQSQQGPQAPQQAPQPQQPDNVVPFPGTFQATTGQGYAHIERVVQLMSRDNCYHIIDFMKNGESVIVNIENIASDTEVQHCIDLLSGAAYTLGCSISKFSTQRRAYLIAPATIQVLLDEPTQRMNGARSTREGGRETSRRARSYASQDNAPQQGYGNQAPQGAGPYQGNNMYQQEQQPQYPPYPQQEQQGGHQQNASYYQNNYNEMPKASGYNAGYGSFAR